MQTAYFDYGISQFKPDPNGRIIVDKLPPGKHKLARIQITVISPTEKSWSTGDQTPFEIRPGETTTLDFGSLEHTVTARFEWPAGIQRLPQWQVGAGLTTLPTIPFALRTNEVARRAFFQTPEFRAAQEKAHEYGAKLVGENQLLANEVQPGNYTLMVAVWEPVGTNMPKQIAIGELPVAVPTGQVSTPIDAGTIQLQPAP
jgi:hypothetical protein